ncbi:MAG: 3-hydroxyacyl-CoA dehydrogenase NAD-binding domain-containing protein, partial [Vicingaceae bacterium]
MKKVAVIGAGTMGNGIAHTFAQSGFKVSLIDISQEALDKAVATISKNLDRMVAKEKISEADKNNTLANLATFTDMNAGVADVELVVEAATENLDLKLKIFKSMDEATADDVILATNTSSISITQIAAVTSRPDKVIGMHFMNPVPIMKLVEIIRGYSTSDEVTHTIMELYKKLGKTPTEVTDYPGFVANRI